MINNILEYGTEIIELFPECTELNRLDTTSVQIKRVLSTTTISFIVTESCNLACSYCYEINKKNKYLTFETAKKFIDNIFDNIDNKDSFINKYNTSILIIEFFGGEPTLNMEVINQITEYFEKYFVSHPDCRWTLFHRYNICSNGLLYFSEPVQTYLKKYKELVSMSITVDGCKAAHDTCRLTKTGEPTYEQAIAAALDLKNYGNISTKITLAPSNIRYVYDSIKNMLELGFPYIHLNCAFEDIWCHEDAVNLYFQLKRVADYIKDNDLYDLIHITLLDPTRYRAENPENLNNCYCGTAGNMVAVTPDGKIYTCVRFANIAMGNSKYEDLSIGRVEHGIGCTDCEKCHISTLSQDTTTLKQSPIECLTCKISAACSYCTAYNYQQFGEFKRATNICDCTKAAALAAKYLCKIVKDKENFDLNMVDDEIALNIISEKEWLSIKNYEET